MATQSDKFKTGFFLRKPGESEPPITYTFTELSRLLIDINSRFAKVNNSIALITVGGGDGSSDDARLDALETTQAALLAEVHALGVAVASLQDAATQVTQAEFDTLAASVSALASRVTTLENKINKPAFVVEVADATPFDAYTAQEASFPVDFTSLPTGSKFFVTTVCETGTLPVEIVQASVHLDVVNNAVLVRFQNNTPTDVLWPATKILLHNFL